MKVKMKICCRSELEFLFTRKSGVGLSYLLDMYKTGHIYSHTGNQSRLRKIYPNILSRV